MRFVLKAMTGIVLMAGMAYATDFRISYSQDDCADVDTWEVWGARNGTAPAVAFRVPNSSGLCPEDPNTPIDVLASAKLRNGTWVFTMRALDSEGTASDWSDPITVKLPLPKPKLWSVVK